MKRFMISGLTVLLTLGSAAIAQAEPAQRTVVHQSTPIQLVSLAERGYLQEQGIPQGNALLTAYDFGQLTARDLIQAAIEDGRVSAGALENANYVNAVENALRGLTGHGDD